MKITGNYFNTPINKKNIKNQPDLEKASFKEQLQSRDSITISASKEQIAEAYFVNALKNKLSVEVKTNISTEELDTLTGEISRGEYEIGANEVARKMLLLESES
ncbi:hypothetical protein [Aminipila sp.]|uniref:hypothetical protein n=1 Tax=Aminipila sp. TaxID=2060095 RepID=UPI00289E430C|nr:hypothetical protein [Aminipila sp.]